MRLAWSLDDERIQLAATQGERVGVACEPLEAPETSVSADALLRWAASELVDVEPAGIEAWLAHLRDDICGNPCAQRALHTALRDLSA